MCKIVNNLNFGHNLSFSLTLNALPPLHINISFALFLLFSWFSINRKINITNLECVLFSVCRRTALQSRSRLRVALVNHFVSLFKAPVSNLTSLSLNLVNLVFLSVSQFLVICLYFNSFFFWVLICLVFTFARRITRRH